MTDIKEKSDFVYEPSTIESVDVAVYNWLEKKMNLFSNTNKGWKKVPVIWVSGERSWQVKRDKDLRNNNQNFILPVITVERIDIKKDPINKGKYWGNIDPINDVKGGSIAIHKVINQDKTSNFANSYSKRATGQPNFKRKNKKVVYETKYIPMPVYVIMTYNINIKTEYQQQMNDLLQPFTTFTGTTNYFIIEDEGHRYEAFVQKEFEQENNVADLKEEERLFSTNIKINVLSHLVSTGNNIEKPKLSKRENIVEVKLPREYAFFEEPVEVKKQKKESDKLFKISTLEDIDTALYNWLNEKVDLFSITNSGWNKIPIIWSSGERSWQVKNNSNLRDKNNNFILPAISVERTSINKQSDKKGKYWGDMSPIKDEKGGSIVLNRKINQDKTSNFANAYSKRAIGQPNFKRENKKIVYETFYSPMIVYSTVTYVIDIKTEYQQQMNDINQFFLTATGGLNYFLLKNEGNRYEAFIDGQFEQDNNTADLQENERLFNTKIKINILANLSGTGKNQNQPYIAKRENIVEVKLPREYAFFEEPIEDEKEKPQNEELFRISTFEDVDISVYNWLDKKMNLSTHTNTGWKKTPVIWTSGERSWQVKNNSDLRDKNDNFILPSITIERTEILKEAERKGKYWGDVAPVNDEKGGSIALYRKINQDKTSNFANAYSKRAIGQPNFKRENKKIVYETFYSPMIIYLSMIYTIDIKTEYLQQMNDLLQPFITFTGTTNYFILEDNGHRYEAFIDGNFDQNNNISDLQENERLFNTKIKINVLANVVGLSKNAIQPYISTRENIVEVKFPKEYSLLGEEHYPTRQFLKDILADENYDYIMTSDGDFIAIPK